MTPFLYVNLCQSIADLCNNWQEDMLLQQLQPFNGFFSRTTWVSQYQIGKPIWILLEQETVSGSGISWAICKSAPCSGQITSMPVPHHSVFLQAGCPSCRPTNSVKALKAQEEDMLLTNKSQKLVYLVTVINTLGGWETTYNAT